VYLQTFSATIIQLAERYEKNKQLNKLFGHHQSNKAAASSNSAACGIVKLSADFM
jgi:hypothetical protein